MYEFNYHQPTSLNEVASLLGANEEAKIVAGGMTLVPTLKFRLAKPSDLIDLAARGARPHDRRPRRAQSRHDRWLDQQ